MDWTDGYYGALYLDSVLDLLTPELSALEAALIARLLALRPEDRVLDLACGHGRHALALAGAVRLVVGLDRSRPYLDRAREACTLPHSPLFVHADLRALPFTEGAFDAAYSWYGSLFMWDDAENAAALRGIARVLRPGGRAVVHHASSLRLAADPVARADRELPDGSVVEEEARYDAASGVEWARRRLVRPDGTALEGTSRLRSYRPEEWGPLARGAGLRVVALTSTAGVDARSTEAPDLVALLVRD
jgi:SAM-dependent methyltransferase